MHKYLTDLGTWWFLKYNEVLTPKSYRWYFLLCLWADMSVHFIVLLLRLLANALAFISWDFSF